MTMNKEKMNPVFFALVLLITGLPAAEGIYKDSIFSSEAVLTDSSQIHRIAEELKEREFIRADFILEKPSPSGEKRLRSSGEFLFSQERGILWHTKKPFDMTAIITSDGSTWECDTEKGECREVSDKSRRYFNIISSMFSGDLEGFNDEFSLYFHITPEGLWGIGLKPERRIIAKYIEDIVIKGKSKGRVTEFIMNTEAGGSTKITFTNHSETPLTEYEKKLFNKTE